MGGEQYTKTRKPRCGKVASPLDKKLAQVEWGEFKIGDLFEIVGTKSLDSNAIDFTKTGINFVGRTFENKGIQGKIKKEILNPINHIL